MLGFKRFIKFVVYKDDAVAIIDALSKYGVAKITRMEDKRLYSITMNCFDNTFKDCLNTLLRLASEKVWIKIVKV